MKKMLRNQKGFSLVELLIVIAIMGVLAALAFSMFAGILGNSRRRADERTADQIAKALTSYIVESGDTKLEILDGTRSADYTVSFEEADGTPAGNPPTVSVASGKDASQGLVEALQHVIVVENNTTNRTIKYGPYLTPKEGSDIGWGNYAPTWSGHKAGYSIIVFSDLQKADVVPVPDNAATTGALDSVGDPLACGVKLAP
ncbi:MAG: prepilin-type N-terminal cleavage/methylation domain-containing protein [Clostridiales bacterium]|nr:prepilin-type N-terminal cleavage/methylation domain-containing protein [Clostridiales bacterium]